MTEAEIGDAAEAARIHAYLIPQKLAPAQRGNLQTIEPLIRNVVLPPTQRLEPWAHVAADDVACP